MNRRKSQLDVVLDIDGFLADFEGYFCHRFGTANRHMERLQDRYPEREQEITDFIADRSTYFMLEAIPVGVSIAKWLMQRVIVYGERRNRANVTILTSRSLRTYEVTRKWLKDEKIPYHQLEFSHDKVGWMKRYPPDLIVDDIIGVCEGAVTEVPGLTAVLLDHPWNQNTPFIPRIKTLSQFQRIYDEVAFAKLLDDSGGVGMAEDLLSS